MEKVYAQRCNVLFKHLKDQGIDQLLIGKPINIYYLTGIMIHPYERLLALLLDARKNSLTIILPGLEQGIGERNGIPEVLCRDEEDPAEKLAGVVDAGAVVGMEFDYFSMALGEKLKENLLRTKTVLLNSSGLVDVLRVCKDGQEIEIIQMAAHYGDLVLEETQGFIHKGITEKQLQLELFKAMSAKQGVVTDSFVIQVLTGELSANPHGTSGDRKLRNGDAITIDYGVCYQHYWSDYSRTFFLGKPDSRLEKIYNVVLEAQMAAIEKVRPGIPAKEVDLTARKIIEKAGYGEQFIHRTGHGIGLDIHEYPKIHSESEILLQEGMVFTIEPGIYLSNLGGVRIEDDVVVTQNGVKVLNRFPKSLEKMILQL